MNWKTVYVDVETIPSQADDALDRIKMNIKPPSRLSKAESIETWWAEKSEEAVKERWLQTALNGAFGELVVIGYAIEDEEAQTVVKVSTESDLLQDFFTRLDGIAPHFVGHNVGFDLRYLAHRSLIRRVRPPFIIPWTSAPWQGKYGDTMFAWCGATGKIKLKELCHVLGIDAGEDIDGSDVWERVEAGDMEAVARHCRLDVERTRKIWKMLEEWRRPNDR